MPLRIDEYSSPVSFGGGLRAASYDAAGALRLEGHLPGDRDVKRAVAREGGSDRTRGCARDGRDGALRRDSGADTAHGRNADPLRTSGGIGPSRDGGELGRDRGLHLALTD